jgi:hypothetical protein
MMWSSKFTWKEVSFILWKWHWEEIVILLFSSPKYFLNYYWSMKFESLENTLSRFLLSLMSFLVESQDLITNQCSYHLFNQCCSIWRSGPSLLPSTSFGGTKQNEETNRAWSFSSDCACVPLLVGISISTSEKIQMWTFLVTLFFVSTCSFWELLSSEFNHHSMLMTFSTWSESLSQQVSEFTNVCTGSHHRLTLSMSTLNSFCSPPNQQSLTKSRFHQSLSWHHTLIVLSSFFSFIF